MNLIVICRPLLTNESIYSQTETKFFVFLKQTSMNKEIAKNKRREKRREKREIREDKRREEKRSDKKNRQVTRW